MTILGEIGTKDESTEERDLEDSVLGAPFLSGYTH